MSPERIRDNSNSISKLSLRWLVIGSSTYGLHASVADLLAAWRSSLNWNWNKNTCEYKIYTGECSAGGEGGQGERAVTGRAGGEKCPITTDSANDTGKNS